MARWQRGEGEIEQMVGRRELVLVTGSEADGTALLAQARSTAATAASLVDADTHSAYVLAYDAARFACNALLAQQGLRATTSGGHYAVESAVRAQFGESFRVFGDLRRRRNELEYPRVAGDAPTADEAEQAVDDAKRLIDGAGRLIDELPFFIVASPRNADLERG
jgi:hypothetical protein